MLSARLITVSQCYGRADENVTAFFSVMDANPLSPNKNCWHNGSAGSTRISAPVTSIVPATSDNLEAISEAASSHSVGSDIEDNENDNLSDMVSANVSGRGTPNISGRDTPLSQVSI